MKRIIKILWGIVILAILIFVLIGVTSKSAVLTWRACSIIMPLIGISFWGAVILTVIDHIQSKK